jgi:hypothetical protein
MTDTTETPPQAPPRKASRARVIAMMIFGGIVLAFGGCAMFLANVNFSGGTNSTKETLSAIGAIGFVAGVLGFFGGVTWAIARWIDRRFDKSKTQ